VVPARTEVATSGIAPVALYVHFPFCLSICPYCDFVVVAGRAARGPGNRIDAVVEALVAEIELRAPRQRPQRPLLESVYVGGGTPSIMEPDQLARLLATADDRFGVAAGAEVTLEANPGPADRGDLAGLRAAGATRLSIGAQSFAPAELRRLGRRHAVEDVARTAREAHAAGFASISLDLLYDVPGQSLESWRASLEAAVELGPDHLSAYALTLDSPPETSDHLPPSRGARQWRARARTAQDEDRAADMYELADDLLARVGLRWYEISNWARDGHQSRHNLTYWLGRPWQAVGPGAHAFDGRTRSWNDARLDAYQAALAGGRLPPGDSITPDDATRAAEAAMLRLRTAAGFDPAAAAEPRLSAALDWGLDQGLLEASDDGRLVLTRRGRLLSNALFERLLPEPVVTAA